MTFRARHLLGIEHLAPEEIRTVLDLSEKYVDLTRRTVKQADALAGLTQSPMFFESSTRTQASFELAGKRLGADVMNMSVAHSSVKKGETLIDTALTLNAMHPDLLVVRHPSSGAVNLLASKVNCAVLNAGDGRHEHPTQALLDALTIRRAKGRIQRLTVAICGDIAHSRVARSNLILLGKMENRVRLIAPPTLMPAGVGEFGCEVFDDMKAGLEGADVVMMLRLQKERMDGGFIPSEREYFHRFGLDAEKLALAKPDAIVMHPDLLVVRHPSSGAVNLLASKVNCAVLNAGDGRHEHPTQALLDALTIRRAKGRIQRLTVAICGDIAHSRVARSNLILLGKMENRVRLIGPPTLMPAGVAEFGCEVFDDMKAGLEGADVVMMLRLQRERMDGGFIPSEREYFHRFGLDAEKLRYAKPDAIVMHPGPMNRGVEIDGELADDINRSVIQEQVEMGVAVRMACMDLLARNLRAERGAKAVGVMV